MVQIFKKIRNNVGNLFKNRLSYIRSKYRYKNLNNSVLKNNNDNQYEKGEDDKRLLSLYPGYRSNLIEFLVKYMGRNGGYLNLKTPDKSDVFSRNYTPKDPISRIDWKAFARTDTLIIREKPKEAYTNVLIVLDVSDSMNWKYEKDISKKELSFRIGMFLGYLHFKKEDLVRFLIFDEKGNEKFLNIRSFSDISYIFDYCIKEGMDKLSIIDNKDNMNDEKIDDKKYLFSDLKHFSYYDLSYVFSDTLSLGYEKYLKPYSIFFHVLSYRELDIDWMSKNEIYYCKDKDKKYSGFYLLKNNFYLEQLKKWLEVQKRSISKQSNYMLLHDRMYIEEFCLNLENILKGIKR